MLARAVLLLTLVAGCARPYPGPKTLAAVGSVLLASGGTAWAVGERTNRSALIAPGFVTTVIGTAAIIGAGGWLAASISCRADPDCPEGEECKEVPAPPGGIPYRQCVKR
jgi:hypothetical protein